VSFGLRPKRMPFDLARSRPADVSAAIQIALEVGEPSQDGHYQPTARIVGVGQRAKRGAALAEVVHDVQEIARRSAPADQAGFTSSTSTGA
jgi:hypothetical protein